MLKFEFKSIDELNKFVQQYNEFKAFLKVFIQQREAVPLPDPLKAEPVSGKFKRRYFLTRKGRLESEAIIKYLSARSKGRELHQVWRGCHLTSSSAYYQLKRLIEEGKVLKDGLKYTLKEVV
jgi:hypothetical protein